VGSLWNLYIAFLFFFFFFSFFFLFLFLTTIYIAFLIFDFPLFLLIHCVEFHQFANGDRPRLRDVGLLGRLFLVSCQIVNYSMYFKIDKWLLSNFYITLIIFFFFLWSTIGSIFFFYMWTINIQWLILEKVVTIIRTLCKKHYSLKKKIDTFTTFVQF
jgi:hypothetical protein